MITATFNPSRVQGWCRAKALLRIQSVDAPGTTKHYWLDSPTPHDGTEAAEINLIMAELVRRINHKNAGLDDQAPF
jgi:hypothetical protein